MSRYVWRPCPLGERVGGVIVSLFAPPGGVTLILPIPNKIRETHMSGSCLLLSDKARTKEMTYI
jgi:hypothetical protein